MLRTKLGAYRENSGSLSKASRGRARENPCESRGSQAPSVETGPLVGPKVSPCILKSHPQWLYTPSPS